MAKFLYSTIKQLEPIEFEVPISSLQIDHYGFGFVVMNWKSGMRLYLVNCAPLDDEAWEMLRLVAVRKALGASK